MTGAGMLGRMLLGLGLLLAVVGLILILADRLPGLRIGRLPGDIAISRGNFRFYFPLATSILLSILFTLLLWIFGIFGRR